MDGPKADVGLLPKLVTATYKRAEDSHLVLPVAIQHYPTACRQHKVYSKLSAVASVVLSDGLDSGVVKPRW